ncbi:hypothetical protein CSAL01_07602 [Colletotrichum salicis]|uniref:Uncharacterized protein n=1 Tax=Colletotrichum salicis TaxID=1209931 RepID=A0A135TJH2_9PEZI|nr:hypothetical protein CSAL01_07602 [Colletotrichum salicis]
MAERRFPRPPEPLVGRDIGIGNQRRPCAGRADRGNGNVDLAVAPGRVGPGDVHAESLHGNPLGRISNQHERTRILAVWAWQTVQQSLGTIRAFDDVRLVFGGHAQPAIQHGT